MKPSFNDNFYCQTLQQWENKTVPGRAVSDQIAWAMRLLPIVLLVGGFMAQSRWQFWLCTIAVAYVFVQLFTFLEEINENLRFVRHQNKALRDGVRETMEMFAKYKDPGRNVTVFDALESLDRKWEDPN